MHKADIKTAVEIYDNNIEIGNKEIYELFGPSTQKITELKSKVKKVMKERDIKTFMRHNVDTATAYEVWGIDIVEYRKRYNQIIKREKLTNSL